MSKLLKLKKWLTVAETVDYLSQSLKEKIQLKDVYQLIIHGELTLSLNFTNSHTAQLGKKVKHPEFGINSEDHNFYKNRSKDICILFEEEVVFLEGTWDLLMLGGDKDCIESRYHLIVNAPVSVLPRLGQVILKKGDKYAKLIVDQEYNSGSEGSIANQLKGEQRLRDKNATEEEFEAFQKEFDEKRRCFNSYRKDSPIHVRFYDVGVIPDNVFEIIKIDSIINLLHRINNPPKSDESVVQEAPMHTKQRHSLLIIIAALCEKLAIDTSERGVAGKIARIVERSGTSISEDTVRNILKDLPEAIIARQK